MRLRRTRAAMEPVAIPAIVPLEFCFSGVMEGVGGFLEEESGAVGGGLFAESGVGVDIGLVLDVDVDVDVEVVLGVGVGVGVVEGRVVRVVGRDVLDEDMCDFSGRLVDWDAEMSEIGLAVYLDVGRSLSLEVVGLRSGLDVEVVIWSTGFEGGEREVGLAVPALLVASRSCVTTLNPASIDDATSAGKAESSTERAFSGSSCGREPDMVLVEPLSAARWQVIQFRRQLGRWLR
jgi:hypothetical protein